MNLNRRFATPMRWGIICSIEDSKEVGEFEEFGKWMVTELEQAASKLHLGHCFMPTPNFAMQAMPGSVEEVARCYEDIALYFPEVIYVIHVLPSKDSVEFKLHKERTCAGVLVGQAILAENALNRFQRYQLEDVMNTMNQWIARRLSQIIARPNENLKSKKNTNSSNNNYRMLVSNSEFGSTEDGSYNQRSQLNQRPANVLIYRNQAANDFEYPVGMVLHKDFIHQPLPPSFYGDQQQSHQLSLVQQNQCRKDECDYGHTVIVKGFPMHFNKYQIASLFPDFRPIHVEHRAVSEAIVQFANKYHAAQVVQSYDGRHYEGENFTLAVCGDAADVQRKVLREKLNELQTEVKG